MTEDLREHLDLTLRANGTQLQDTTWGGNVSGSFAAELHAAADLLAAWRPCRETRLSFYENRIVKCWVTGPHPIHEGLEFNGEVREWQ